MSAAVLKERSVDDGVMFSRAPPTVGECDEGWRVTDKKTLIRSAGCQLNAAEDHDFLSILDLRNVSFGIDTYTNTGCAIIE